MSRTHFTFACPHVRPSLLAAAGLAAASVALLAAGPASAHHAGRPHAPKPLRVAAKSTTAVTFTWKKTGTRFSVLKNSRRVAMTTRNRSQVRNLRCGQAYRLGVRAFSRAGKKSAIVSRWVKTRPCAPAPAPAPPPPPAPTSAPASTTAPSVSGSARVGSVLAASRGTWIGTAPIAYAYAWLRCNAAGGACSPISGASGTAYFLAAADEGATLRVRVTASNAYGSAVATSAQTAAVTPGTSSSSCSRADATGCAAVAGSRISLLNDRFSCRGSLAELAAENPIGSAPGKLPLLVEVHFTTYVTLDPAVIELREGCHGDGNDETIDLVLRVEGDGRTRGGGADAIKVRLTARDVQLTGYANCGPRGLGADGRPDTSDDAHQDGAQIQGGDTIEFIDFEWGDWETSTATCQGAAGTFVPGSVNGNPVTGMACIRCKSVSCNHGMLFSGSTGTLVVDSMWRTGNPADRAVPLANGQVGLCRHSSPPCVIDTAKAFSYTVLGNVCDRWPYGDET